MRLLYFHGGPGFNSNPEYHLLTKPFKEASFDLACWNEPSALRDKDYNTNGNAFEQYLDSAEAFLLTHYQGEHLNLIGHSFGAHAALYLCKQHPEKIKNIIFISSGLCVSCADVNLFTLTIEDFEKANDSKAEELKQVLKNYSGRFDENTKNGMQLLLQNPNLFSHYWVNKERMQQFLPYYSGDQYKIDVTGFFGVRQTWFPIELPQTGIPAIGVYGKYDPVISKTKERELLQKQFSNTTFCELDYSAHYPHVEETDAFLKILASVLLVK